MTEAPAAGCALTESMAPNNRPSAPAMRARWRRAVRDPDESMSLSEAHGYRRSGEAGGEHRVHGDVDAGPALPEVLGRAGVTASTRWGDRWVVQREQRPPDHEQSEPDAGGEAGADAVVVSRGERVGALGAIRGARLGVVAASVHVASDAL